MKLYSEVDSTEKTIQERLINCFLINKHFIMVMEKKKVDFTDYVLSGKSLSDKAEMCYRYLRNY